MLGFLSKSQAQTTVAESSRRRYRDLGLLVRPEPRPLGYAGAFGLTDLVETLLLDVVRLGVAVSLRFVAAANFAGLLASSRIARGWSCRLPSTQAVVSSVAEAGHSICGAVRLCT